MKNDLLNFKEFELSEMQQLLIGGGTFMSGYGNQGKTMSADTNTRVGQSGTFDVDAGGVGDQQIRQFPQLYPISADIPVSVVGTGVTTCTCKG